MKIEQLIYFHEVARLQHIRKASEVLNITSSAISHSIAALEGELQCKLFEKKGKNIHLTKEGHNLFLLSERLIKDFLNLKAKIKTTNEDQTFYSVGAVHGISSSLLTSAWQHLSQEFPNMTLEIQSLRSAAIFDLVVERKIDVGILFSPVEHPDIARYQIHTGQLIIVVAKNHPVLKFKPKDQLSKIDQYPANLPKAFHTIDPCMKNPIFEKHGINPWGQIISDSYHVGLDMVRSSQYWALIPECILQCFPDDFAKVALPTNWDAQYNLSMIWHKNQYVPEFFQMLLQHLQKQLNHSK